MKKIFIALIFSLWACVASAGSAPITFHTGAVGGLYMEPSIIWADQMRAAVPGLQISCVLGGSRTNPIVVATTTSPNQNLGCTDIATAVEVVNGKEDYAKRLPGGTKALRALWRYNVKSWLHVLARPEVVPEGVTTLGQLLEKNPKIHIQMKPRSGEQIGWQLLETYGYDYDSIRAKGGSLTFNSQTDMAALMIDGHADVAISPSRAPSAYILDIEASIPNLRWLAVDEKNAKEMSERYGYIMGNQPTGAYSSQKEPVPTLAVDHFVFVNENMDEDLAYVLTKAVLQGIDKMRAALPAMATFDANEAGTNLPVPLHKGAIRAYQELNLPYAQ